MNNRTRKKQVKIIWDWYLHEQDLERPSKRTISALRWFVRHDIFPDYNYVGSWKSNLEYCSDRMNGGRAKAILRLLKR